MGKPAARVGDMHVCPMVTGTVPHVGGPIMPPGVPTVLIGGIPAATLGNMATCTGPPDSIILGSTGVMIGGKPAARMGDQCSHGGVITVGCPTVLVGETMSVPMSVPMTPPPPARSKCKVKFWPEKAWKGEFGFDWLRKKESGRVGDVDYENIVGEYGTTYATQPGAVFTAVKDKYISLKSNFYDPFWLSWQNTEGFLENMSSWLSLFPKEKCSGNKKYQAKLLLDIEIAGSAPESLKFQYDEQYLELDKSEVSPRWVGRHKIKLTVKCLKEFVVDQEIKVINETKDNLGNKVEQVAGKLIVLRNSRVNRRKADVVFVRVKTKINGEDRKGSTSNESEYLERYLHQTLTSLNVKEEVLDLRTDASFNTNYTLQIDPKTRAVAFVDTSGGKIHSMLEDAFKKAKPKYNDWYKVFFFDEQGGYERGGSYVGLNGAANGIPSKSVVLFNTHTTATTTHELLHAIGLYHTFDNSGSYVYRIGETETIMDYSHQPKYGSKDRICTWKWQWDKIRAKLNYE